MAKTSKVVKLMLMTAVIAILLFIVLLYATIKTKSTDISQYEPFKKWIGRTVVLNRQAGLFKEEFVPNGKYPYTLFDSLHPQWQYISDRKDLPEPDIMEIRVCPIGTKLKLDKAIQYTNGVSGLSTPILFGTLHDGKKEYKVAYSWGERSDIRYFDHVDACWQFHLAPWQTEQDTVYYVLPEAKWW